MNSARFIRRRSILALWIITPIAVITVVMVTSGGVLEHEKIRLMQDRELALLVPAMEGALAEFDRFKSDYRPGNGTRLSMEDRHIALFNSAAEDINFTVTAINLEQDPPDKTPPGIIRISLFVKGSGSNGGIAAFLNNVRAKDRFLYEKRIQITSGRAQADSALLEAEFGRIYIEKEEP
jgi:hypothetical protein